jgi:LPXTG-site transpeptidase (sortase) family protein
MADPDSQGSKPRPAATGRGGLLYDTRFVVALFILGIGIAATGAWQLILPRSAISTIGKSLPGNDSSLPVNLALPLAVTAVVVLALVGWAIASRARGRAALSEPEETTPRRDRRRVYRTRVLAAVVTLVLVGTGVNVIGPNGLRRIPGEVTDALQGVVARPESGFPRIKVPRVGIDLLLVKGDGRTPPVRYEAFTYPGADHLLSGTLGGGNSYVYAHARHDMFGRLHDLHAGDVIEVDYGGARVLRYGVSEIHSGVNWKDLSWLTPTVDDRLTLQTCNGWQDDDPRFIVVARRLPGSTA